MGLVCFAAREIFLDQRSNLHLLHWQADSLPLSHQGNRLHLYLQPLPLGLHDCLSSTSCQISNSIRLSWEHEPYSEMQLQGSRLCGEGNGSPLQYSCLENPVDRGAWWAAVHRVAQSWTWLKWLSNHACTGEGNGNPLQCSWLENPRDRGAWWAAVYGVTQSWTRLKRLSSHSRRLYAPDQNLMPDGLRWSWGGDASQCWGKAADTDDY